MAKKVPAVSEEEKEKRYSVVIDQDLVRPLRLLAASLDVSPPDLVNNRLRRIIGEELDSTLGGMGYRKE